MKDLEKIFSDGLKHHEVGPPPGPWDTLAQRLRYQRRKRRVAYVSAAAACLLLLALGTGFFDQNEPPPVAGPVPPKDSINHLNKDKQLIDDQLVDNSMRTDTLKKLDRAQSTEVAPVTRQPTVPSAAAVPVEAPPLKVPPTLADATKPTSARTPKAPREAPVTRTRVVDASRYRKSPRDTVPDTTPPPVTVIYQPNPATLAQEESLGRKVADALTQIKASKVSLGELRSAKDDLVDKVFDRKPNESPPR